MTKSKMGKAEFGIFWCQMAQPGGGSGGFQWHKKNIYQNYVKALLSTFGYNFFWGGEKLELL